MEWADSVLVFVLVLALLCGAAALPRSLLTVAFLTVVATVAVVVLFEVAPTKSPSGGSSAVVLDHSKPLNPRGSGVPGDRPSPSIARRSN